jgi:hypothetical protein
MPFVADYTSPLSVRGHHILVELCTSTTQQQENNAHSRAPIRCHSTQLYRISRITVQDQLELEFLQFPQHMRVEAREDTATDIASPDKSKHKSDTSLTFRYSIARAGRGDRRDETFCKCYCDLACPILRVTFVAGAPKRDPTAGRTVLSNEL